MLASGKRAQHRCVKLTSQSRDERDCRSVELRALCNEVPRTPPGPEGSNGTGIALCAPDHPKFLAPRKVIRAKYSVLSPAQPQRSPLTFGEPSFSFARLRLAAITESDFSFRLAVKLLTYHSKLITFLHRRGVRDSPS